VKIILELVNSENEAQAIVKMEGNDTSGLAVDSIGQRGRTLTPLVNARGIRYDGELNCSGTEIDDYWSTAAVGRRMKLVRPGSVDA